MTTFSSKKKRPGNKGGTGKLGYNSILEERSGQSCEELNSAICDCMVADIAGRNRGEERVKVTQDRESHEAVTACEEDSNIHNKIESGVK